MSAFDIANWMAIFVAWFALLMQSHRIEKSKLTLFILIVVLLAPFALVAKLSVIVNLVTLLCSLAFFTSSKRIRLAQPYFSMPFKSLGILFLAALFLLPIILKDAQGWMILLGLASKYWFLFSLAVLYSVNRDNYRIKAKIAVVTLLAGLLWNFKIAFVFFASVAIEYIIKTRSIKGLLAMAFGVAILFAATYFLFLDAFLLFLERSVLRPDYKYDTKIFGFSDGARLTIWAHYLENSVWFGRGEYFLPDVVPPHNIIVHIAHELGFLGVLTIGPLFLYFIVAAAFRNGIITALLFLLSLGLSSVAEYPSMWVYCFLLAPIILESPTLRKRLVLFRSTRFG